MQKSKITPQAPLKILIANPFGVGDVLFTTPLVENLKAVFPDSPIDFICNARVEEILETNPCLRRVIIFEKDEFRQAMRESVREGILKICRFLRQLYQGRYDMVFDLTNNAKYGLVFKLLGIRERIGFDYRKRGRFLTRRLEVSGFSDGHFVQHYLRLLSLIAIVPRPARLSLFTDASSEAWAEEFFQKNVSSFAHKVCAVAPGGGASFGPHKSYIKRWPLERFISLMELMEKEKGIVSLLLWGPGEEELVREVEARCRCRCVIAPLTTMRRMAALMKRCDFVLTNDGGPLHIAVASSVSTVSIFGFTDERNYGPYNQDVPHMVVKADLPCRPCYRKFKTPECERLDCLKQITVEQVWEKVRLLWDKLEKDGVAV